MTDLYIDNLAKCAGLVGSAPDLFDCECCQVSQIYSNIFNICPNSNLTAIGFGTFFAAEQNLLHKMNRLSHK